MTRRCLFLVIAVLFLPLGPSRAIARRRVRSSRAPTATKPDNGIVSYWKLDEGSEAIAHDSAGNNHGKIHGATWADGKSGKALSFDGVDDYVDLNYAPGANIENLTISMWVKAAPGEPYSNAIGGYQRGSFQIIIEKLADGGFTFLLDTKGVGGLIMNSGSTVDLADGRWHHIVGIKSGNTLFIYADGAFVSSNTNTNLGNVTMQEDMYLGAFRGDKGVYYFFEGMIDEVVIYNRALSAAEIQWHYQNGMKGPAVARVRSRAIRERKAKGPRGRADSLFARGQWEKAERSYRKLAEHSRGEERSYAEYKVGVCQAKQGRYPEAVATWYKLFVFDKESEWSARAMEEAAEICISQLGEKDKGLWLYEWLAERFPDRAPLLTPPEAEKEKAESMRLIRGMWLPRRFCSSLLRSEDLPGQCKYFREVAILYDERKNVFQIWCLAADRPKDATKYRVYYSEFHDVLNPEPLNIVEVMKGDYSRYDTEGIRKLSVIYDDLSEQYRLWTCSYYTSGWKTEIRYFSSDDGLKWIEGPKPFSASGTEDFEWPVAIQLSDGTMRLYYIHQDKDRKPYYIYRCDIGHDSTTPTNQQNTGIRCSGWLGGIAFSDNHHRLWWNGPKFTETFDCGKTWSGFLKSNFDSERFFEHFAGYYDKDSGTVLYLCITSDQKEVVLTTDYTKPNTQLTMD